MILYIILRILPKICLQRGFEYGMGYPAVLESPLFFLLVLVAWFCIAYYSFCTPNTMIDSPNDESETKVESVSESEVEIEVEVEIDDSE